VRVRAPHLRAGMSAIVSPAATASTTASATACALAGLAMPSRPRPVRVPSASRPRPVRVPSASSLIASTHRRTRRHRTRHTRLAELAEGRWGKVCSARLNIGWPQNALASLLICRFTDLAASRLRAAEPTPTTTLPRRHRAPPHTHTSPNSPKGAGERTAVPDSTSGGSGTPLRRFSFRFTDLAASGLRAAQPNPTTTLPPWLFS